MRPLRKSIACLASMSWDGDLLITASSVTTTVETSVQSTQAWKVSDLEWVIYVVLFFVLMIALATWRPFDD